MKVYGKSKNGKTISIEVDSEDTIETLNEKIINAEYFENNDNIDEIVQLFYNLILNHLVIEDEDNKFKNICSNYIKSSIKEITNIPDPDDDETCVFSFYSFEPVNDIDKIMKKLYDKIYKYLDECDVYTDCSAACGLVDYEIKNILSRNINSTIVEIQKSSGSLSESNNK